MPKIHAILSMLHEPSGADSSTRQFRGQPVLAWTLRRLELAAGLDGITILCWQDQSETAKAAIAGSTATVRSLSPREHVASLDAISASRRWADGWRGGLLSACEFDRGFHGPWISDIQRATEADAVLLVDPAAALVDPVLIEAVLQHWRAKPDLDMSFAPAAPGLCGVLIAKPLLDKLAAGNSHPGVMMSYRPDSPRRDPIGEPACVQIPIPLARTTHRFTFDSTRQIEKLSAATSHLNGQLLGTGAMGLLAALQAAPQLNLLPREVVQELNTQRATDPIYWPGRRLGIERPPITVDAARAIFRELAEADDARLVIAGVGDPMLHDAVIEIIQAAHDAGIKAIALETDFVGIPTERLAALVQSPVDIVSVCFPATCAATYQGIMNVDAFAEAMHNIKLFVHHRQSHGRGLPLLVPTFMKCRDNQAEMEVWYDHWLRTLGCAVITSPSDYGGLIPETAAADMAGPKRRPCISLNKRLSVLSDGQVVSCEQDVLARQPMGRTIKESWQCAAAFRCDHQAGNWANHPACASCKQWNRA